MFARALFHRQTSCDVHMQLIVATRLVESASHVSDLFHLFLLGLNLSCHPTSVVKIDTLLVMR